METVYCFEDWTSAVMMKNIFNPCYKIDIGVLRDTNESEIVGYQLTVTDTSDSKTIYRTYIDYDAPGIWSLSTDEAIQILNRIGFLCKFERVHYQINDTARRILEGLRDLEYSHIRKTANPLMISVLGADHIWKNLRHVMNYKYNYLDFSFLADDAIAPTSIEGILENSEG